MYRPSLHQQHQEPPKQQFQLALRYAQPGLAQPNLPPPPPGFVVTFRDFAELIKMD